jgi:hypothetical protein
LPGHEQDGGRGKETSPQIAQQEVTERQAPVREAVAPVPAAGGAETAAERPAAQHVPPPRVESVLERFRLFQGEKTVGSLAALFKRDGAVSFSQSPAIAIADGKSSVRLAISGVTGDKAPNFTFHAARFVSLSHTGVGAWEVEVTPEPGAVQAGVTMFMNGTQQEFPLTVTPKVDLVVTKGAGVGESDFLFFLKERGTTSAPKFDLNGDGRRDYLDDYIFTANYLLQLDEKEKQKTAQQPRQ